MLAVVNPLRLRTRHRLVPLALLGALTLSPACSKKGSNDQAAKQDDSKSTSPKTTTPTTAPAPGLVENPVDSPAVAVVGEVVATIQLPSGTNMSDIAAAIDSVQPGASIMLKMQLPALLEQAAGFDLGKSAKLDAPMSFVILDPTSHPKPLALLVTAKDPAKLAEQAKAEGHAVEQRGDLTLIGPADVIAGAKDFAFSNLTKYPDHSEIIIYPRPLVGSYAGMIREGISSSMALLGGGNDGVAQMMQAYVDGIVALGEQTDRLVLSVGGGSGTIDLLARVYPLAGSQAEAFVGAQAPSTHALLDKLPAGGAMMAAAGDMRAGASRDALLHWGVSIMASMYGSMSADEWSAMFEPWLDNFDGTFAMKMNMAVPTGGLPTMEMQILWGVADPEAMLKSWRELLTKVTAQPLMEIMGTKFVASHTPAALTHDGVEIDLYASKIDASALPPEQTAALEATGSGNQSLHLASFDKVAAMANADEDGQSIRTLIDTVRGKNGGFEPSTPLENALERSKQRGESIVFHFDLSVMLASMPVPPPQPMPFRGMTFGIGRHDDALSVRISLTK